MKLFTSSNSLFSSFANGLVAVSLSKSEKGSCFELERVSYGKGLKSILGITSDSTESY